MSLAQIAAASIIAGALAGGFFGLVVGPTGNPWIRLLSGAVVGGLSAAIFVIIRGS